MIARLQCGALLPEVRSDLADLNEVFRRGREVYEEAGLEITSAHCLFVFEVIPPDRSTRTLEITFRGDLIGGAIPDLTGEGDRRPQWVELDETPRLNLRPPLAGHLHRVANDHGPAYLGNMWRS